MTASVAEKLYILLKNEAAAAAAAPSLMWPTVFLVLSKDAPLDAIFRCTCFSKGW